MDTAFLYENYIKPDPKGFLKIVSFNYPLSKDLILRHYPMLCWEFYGIVENPFINWDIDMFERFQPLITTGLKSCWRQKDKNTCFNYLSFKKSKSLATTFLKNEKYLKKNIEKIERSGALLFENIDEAFLEQYRNILRIDDWKKISKNYNKPIRQELLSIYWKEFDLLDVMLFNENVCWTDPETFRYFLHNKPWMLSCSSILWNKIFKPFLDEKILEGLLTKIKSEKKKFRVIWSEEKKGKYFMEIFIQKETTYQLIDMGYYFSSKPIELRKIFDFSDKYEIFATNEKSQVDGKNIRTLTFKEYNSH